MSDHDDVEGLEQDWCCHAKGGRDYRMPPPYGEVLERVEARRARENSFARGHELEPVRRLFGLLHRLYFDFSMKSTPEHSLGELGIDVRLPTVVMDEIRVINRLLRTEYGPGSGMRFVVEHDGLYLAMSLLTNRHSWQEIFYVQQPQRLFSGGGYDMRSRDLRRWGRAPKVRHLRAYLRAAIRFAASGE